MPRNQGITFEQWGVCARCGFPHPLHMLYPQMGMLLCKDHGCYDSLESNRRPYVIGRILAQDSLEGSDRRGEKNQTLPGDIPEF